jgi:uncharacterized protein YciI
MTEARDIRFVVIHRPGPAWRTGVPVFEQEGLQRHAEHYRAVRDAGKLDLGGPFLDDASGGMMMPAAGMTREEVDALARSDPTVASGLLVYEIRPWLVAMKR